jgi:hypothetical protein
MAFFDWLERKRHIYVVMNNYEELPQVIPSDVDFTIDPRAFASLDRHIIEFAQLNGATVVQKLWHGNRKCAYILATESKDIREFIQLDFFVEFSIKGCPNLISHKEMVAGRRRLRTFYVPRPEMELIFIVMRRLFKNDWSERHCKRLAELRSSITSNNRLPERYAWLSESIDLACEGDIESLALRRPYDWMRLKRIARDGMSLREKLKNYGTQIWRILFRLQNETGNLSLVLGGRSFLKSDEFQPLSMVFHRKLVIDENWLATRSKHSFVRLILYLALLKRRKGLVLVDLERGEERIKQLGDWLDNIGLVDQVFEYESAKVGRNYRARMIYAQRPGDMVEAMIESQSAKASKAIERGFSQTSK